MDAYAILEVVGEGSFGRVFKAKHKQTHAVVALKLIRKIGRSARELENLRRECEILQELRHPNIISLMDSFETNSEVVVVMEFAAGELFATIGTGSQLNRENMLQVTCDLLSALYYLHSHRILHRDIKPQNILLGVDGRVKLCDFGFARIMNLNTYLLTSIKGTPLYMAPEIIQEKPYDHSADLWSLGCILYELVTGTPLFNTSSIIELVKKVTTEPIQFPKSDRLYPECQSFMEGLLQKDPRQRLTWPEILEHEFVRDKLDLHLTQSTMVPLTHPLSESQERRREEQRLDLEAKSRGQGQSLVRAVQQMEMEKQRKIREAMIVMEAARRHRVCPPPPAETFQKYFKTGLNEPFEPTVAPEEPAATPPQEPEEDDVEDVPIASRARRRESMISSMDNFESDIRKFAGVPELPDAVPEEHGVDDDDRTVVADSPKVNRANKPSFPIDETLPVHRDEWERFLKTTLKETKAAPAAEPLDAADMAALLVPLRASEIDPVVVSGIVRVFMHAVIRTAHNADAKRQLLAKFIECGAVGNIISCIARITLSVEDEPDEEQVATFGILFEFLSCLFVLDEWLATDCLATRQFTQTWKYFQGTQLDVFPALKKCLSWYNIGAKTLGAAMCMFWRMWHGAKEDLRGNVVELFLNLKGRLFELVGAVGKGGSKGEVDAAIQALTLLMLIVHNGILPDAKNDDDLRDKLTLLSEGAELGASRAMLKKGAAMLLSALDKKRRIC